MNDSELKIKLHEIAFRLSPDGGRPYLLAAIDRIELLAKLDQEAAT